MISFVCGLQNRLCVFVNPVHRNGRGGRARKVLSDNEKFFFDSLHKDTWLRMHESDAPSPQWPLPLDAAMEE